MMQKKYPEVKNMSEEDKFVNQVIRKVRDILNNKLDQSVSHRWDHVERVYKRAIKLVEMIGESRNIDEEILKIAALLHDIDQPYNNKQNHVSKSLKKAEEILYELNYPANKIQKVLRVILEHSSEDNKQPSTPEAKILFDADKLDGLGAIGIARVFALSGQQGLTPSQAIEWYKQKIKKALPMMQTNIAKKIVERELAYVNSFFEKYKKEEEKLL